MVTHDISTLTQLDEAVALIIATVTPREGATVLALHGELGAGKTTFVQHLARSLGVAETITSPTFVIEKRYETKNAQFPHLVHIDAYRIEHLNELRPLRLIDTIATPHTLVCIEWAERVTSVLPPDTVHLTFAEGEGGRQLRVEQSLENI